MSDFTVKQIQLQHTQRYVAYLATCTFLHPRKSVNLRVAKCKQVEARDRYLRGSHRSPSGILHLLLPVGRCQQVLASFPGLQERFSSAARHRVKRWYSVFYTNMQIR